METKVGQVWISRSPLQDEDWLGSPLKPQGEGVDHVMSPEWSKVLYQKKMGEKMRNRYNWQGSFTDLLCLKVLFGFPTNVSENREDFYRCRGKTLCGKRRKCAEGRSWVNKAVIKTLLESASFLHDFIYLITGRMTLTSAPSSLKSQTPTLGG